MRTLLEVAAGLEQHEAVCSERYRRIDDKLQSLDRMLDRQTEDINTRVDEQVGVLKEDLDELKSWFKWGLATFITGICGILGTLLFGG